MGDKIFVYKDGKYHDRDCVKYTEIDRLGKLECNHYFPSFGLSGACFSSSLYLEDIDFDNVITVLTKQDFEMLDAYNKAIHELGNGIVEGGDRWSEGYNLYKTILPIIERLKSEENEELFEKVIEAEKEYIMDEYFLDDEEYHEVMSNYHLEYKDRAVIGYVYNDVDDMATEEAFSMGYVKDGNDRYFNYENFAEDLLRDDYFYEMQDGRVVKFCY